jgi:hypothetical protein
MFSRHFKFIPAERVPGTNSVTAEGECDELQDSAKRVKSLTENGVFELRNRSLKTRRETGSPPTQASVAEIIQRNFAGIKGWRNN